MTESPTISAIIDLILFKPFEFNKDHFIEMWFMMNGKSCARYKNKYSVENCCSKYDFFPGAKSS